MTQPPYPPPPGPYQGWPPPPPPGPARPPGGRTGLLIGLIAGGMAVLAAVAIAVAVIVTRQDDDAPASGPSARPGAIAGGAEARIGVDGSLTMVKPGVERPVVDVYEDFACPPCGRFDKEHDPTLKQLVVAGQAKVVFRPMVIFSPDRQPMHGNALRAAAALRCVADGARWLSYQDALYDHQPPTETTPGYRPADLVSYAASSGLTGDGFAGCVKDQKYASAVLATSRTYIGDGLQGTPSVRVNGRTLGSSDTRTAAALRTAILNAR